MAEHDSAINYSVWRKILNYWVEMWILWIILFLYYVRLSIHYWFLPKVRNSNELYVYTYTRIGTVQVKRIKIPKKMYTRIYREL